MIGVLGHDSALQGYASPETTWANEMNFVVIHAPDAGSIAQPVDLQSNVLPLNSTLLLGSIDNIINLMTQM